MKAPLVVSFLALALSVVTLAVIVSLNSRRNPKEPAPALAVANESDAGLRARVEELAAEVRRLSNQVAVLESSPATELRTPVAPEFATREELAELREELRAALAKAPSLAQEVLAESEEFEEQVALTLSRIRKSESVDAARVGLEKRTRGIDLTMPKITTWLELDTTQAESMRSALLAQYERESELLRRWEAGEDPERLGEVKVADQELHRLELAGFLSPAQLERYTSRGSKD